MSSSIRVISARYDNDGQKVDHIRLVDTLDDAFTQLDREDCYYNFAYIEIRHNDFIYTIDRQNRIYRPLGYTDYTPDRRQGGGRRKGDDRRKTPRDGRAEGDRRCAPA